MNALITLGYSGWKPEQIKALVEERGAILLDIRYSANSMRPEWRRNALWKLLDDRYQHVPALGNRNYKNGGEIELAAPYKAVPLVKQLLERGPVILMCACRSWQGCHRLTAANYLQMHFGDEVQIEHVSPPA